MLNIQLRYPDYNKPFVFCNDTSLFVTGVWLSKLDSDIRMVAIVTSCSKGSRTQEGDCGNLINGRDLLLKNWVGTHLLGDYGCISPLLAELAVYFSIPKILIEPD